MNAAQQTSLDALKARATKRVELEQAEKEAKARVKAAKSHEEKFAANREADAIRALIDWRPVALAQRIEHWTCSCGAEGRAPGGLFVFSEHVRWANATRFAAPKSQGEIDAALPRKVAVVEKTVAVCPECGPRFGFTTLLRKEGS